MKKKGKKISINIDIILTSTVTNFASISFLSSSISSALHISGNGIEILHS